jgi:hypothetical protein
MGGTSMTIPQIFSSVGWSMFTFALAFLILHTVNLATPRVDFVIPSTDIGVYGFLVAIPAVVIGFVLGVIGFFGERIEVWWLERQRDK